MHKTPPSLQHALDVVVLTQEGARIWHGLPNESPFHAAGPESHGIGGTELHQAPEIQPQHVSAPDPHRSHHHVRTGQAHHMHHPDPDNPKYFDDVAEAICDADRILLVGHGQGRSNMADAFLKHARQKHHDIAKRVIGTINANIPALTEPQIVELAHSWYARYCRTV